MIDLVDSHCHLHDLEFFTEEEAEQCLKRARDAGVRRVVCIGTSHADSLRARAFADAHSGVYWTYGIHPESSAHYTTDFFSEAVAAISSNGGHPVAIGEVGLDYHYPGYSRDKQIKLFEEMLQLAVDHDLPVSFHIREAFDDFFPIIKEFPKVRGVVHSFTDSKKTLRRILSETEFLIGLNGLATYSTLPLPPAERILLETDAPFLAPIPYRGNKNEPSYIATIADWLATRTGITVDTVANTTTQNAVNLFGLKD